jgi:pyruvate dehydrogenase E2 component (dihydrolipoamide acetyltransferase)
MAMTDAPTGSAPPTLAKIIGSYGEIEQQPLSRIQSFTAKAMTRNWSTIPHVTHWDRIDVTALEATRARGNLAGGRGMKLSPLPYLLKAIASVLVELPRFNAVFDGEHNALILRKYVNIGVAIDTAAGLVVGVVRACDQRSLEALAADITALSDKARGKGLGLAEMSGAGFTVSSLGLAGGDGFTPIINSPEVAIIGVSRLTETPRKTADGAIAWRSLLPVALSYDHRALNGSDAGRFMLALQAHVDRLASGRRPDRDDQTDP